jgi:hypothetical protein
MRVRPSLLGACATAACIAWIGCGGPRPSSSASSSVPSTSSSPTGPAPSKPGIVLGRPTDVSITASVKVDADTEVYLEYGSTAGVYTGRSASAIGKADFPVLLVADALVPDTQYFYRARYRGRTETTFRADTEAGFHTQRLPGRTFSFVIQADPHLDGNSSTAVYAQTLANELADRPDFMVDLGDTSMVEKCAIDGNDLCASPAPATLSSVNARYSLMRSYFEQPCHSVPLFMVLGNHDGETGWADPAAGSSLALWGLAARRSLFANPEPDRFYSASADSVPGIGLRQNYYAFEWGDALFVVLDPYTYTARKPGADGWGWTLGAAQYEWLARRLSSSRARFKFVFTHHLVGGNGTETRGGAAFAQLFEWGGRDVDSSWAFDRQRPGWAVPIHQLLVDNHVTAWFHGHDHLYAREELDGVIYQEVPQPSLARYDTADPGKGYGYEGSVGTNIFPSSGHLRVTVSGTEVKVEYVRSVAPADETATRKNGTVVTNYVTR